MMLTDRFLRSALRFTIRVKRDQGGGLVGVLIDFGRWRNSDAQPVAPPQLEPAPAVHPKQ